MSPFFYAQISSLTHNFRGKPGTSLAIMPVQDSMEQHHNERKRKRKSSSGKSPFGSAALNGRSSSASAPSLINSSHKITSLTHNFRGKPGTSLAMIPAQNSMYYNFTQKGNDQPLTTPVGMPAILIGTNSTQDVQQDCEKCRRRGRRKRKDLVLLSIIEEVLA